VHLCTTIQSPKDIHWWCNLHPGRLDYFQIFSVRFVHRAHIVGFRLIWQNMFSNAIMAGSVGPTTKKVQVRLWWWGPQAEWSPWTNNQKGLGFRASLWGFFHCREQGSGRVLGFSIVSILWWSLSARRICIPGGAIICFSTLPLSM
jgi:hypothetical protein